MSRKGYVSVFSTRYAGAEMQYLFSEEFKFTTWRRLWTALARAEKELGLPISEEQLSELDANIDNINYEAAEARESQVRHDVMSHVYAYGLQCPSAAGVIHLGATSCYVGDNTDIIIMRRALAIIRKKLLRLIELLADFSDKYKALPCLGYTHLQPAQLTTLGKRAATWLYDFYLDYLEVKRRESELALLGSRGATGTQASFLELFEGDEAKVEVLEGKIASELGFERVVPVSGQTYTRKQDYLVLSALASLAASASKLATDLRLLASFKEVEEPFEEHQIGSSAMPYKRNPMRSERVCALARYLMAELLNPLLTEASQMFERTLDDSANRRLSISESFLCADAILNILLNICKSPVVYERVIAARIEAELPFMATENILMEAVKRGGDRQLLHERLREHSLAAADKVKLEGRENDLLERIAADESFSLTLDELKTMLNPQKFTGLAARQTESFLKEYIRPLLDENKALLSEIDVEDIKV
ncbi:MAG: adenylosuccinate lyase [Oscillospiraceae bacterium]|nr:adenylosuccinate lyase [Oscillospiraceae bacterium]